MRPQAGVMRSPVRQWSGWLNIVEFMFESLLAVAGGASGVGGEGRGGHRRLGGSV
jgi:hypothetical protein